MLDQLVANSLLNINSGRAELRHPIDNIGNKVETIKSVTNSHVKRCRC